MSAAVRIERFLWAEWALALTVSVLVNLLAFLVFGVMMALEIVREQSRVMPPPEPVAMIHPDQLRVEEVAGEDVAVPKRAAVRTSADQPSEPKERARFIGERDTSAASSRDPVVKAPRMPSQAGEEPKYKKDLVETTESNFQDGTLEHDQIAQPTAPAAPAAPAEMTPAETKPATGEADGAEPAKAERPDPLVPEPAAPPRERLAEGPVPVDRAMPPEPRKKRDELREAGQPDAQAGDSAAPPATAGAKQREPGFRGHQRRTQLRGAISRRGTSSLDVDDSSLGRYQAALSRAVEREWQRNCVRYRDFIMPGFLTLRFLVESDGGVRKIEFVEVVEASEIQKGFTLNSVRNAPIPKMPPGLKKEMDGDPLELIYSFIF